MDQTYQNRELLILADGQDVRDLVPKDDRITITHLAEVREIGDKRNFGCSIATGEVIAHWDDDDFSAPERLADQIRRLNQSGKAVTGYRSMRFVRDDGRSWQFTYTPGHVLGTSLCYRRDWWESNQFPAIQKQEDSEFVVKAWNQHQLDECREDLGLMYATIHDGNTSPRELDKPCYRAL